MRYPSEHKEQTRRRILEAASRLFREKGYNGVGVDEVMAEAGLTAGGFYSHFSSKEALFAESINYLAETMESRSDAKLGDRRDKKGEVVPTALHDLIKGYLSRTHRDKIAEGCLLPSLTPDVVRGSDATRVDFERLVLKILGSVESKMTGESEDRRDRALGVLAQLVGGLMLSRAVNDRKLSDQMLLACRRAAFEISGVQVSAQSIGGGSTREVSAKKEGPNERDKQNEHPGDRRR